MYTAESESLHFCSAFSPTAISLTPRFHQKHKVLLHFFIESAQNDPKTRSYEDNAKFHYLGDNAPLCYALSGKWGVIEIFEYLGEFEEGFRKG
jgi:hypothetical protein